MRWILALALLLMPAASLAQALAPQSSNPPPPLTQGPTWSLKTWPTTAMMDQVERKNGVATLLLTLQCTNGDKQIVERRYQQAGQAAPADAIRCGRLCQFGLQGAAIGGLRSPVSFTERQSTMKAMRRLVVEDLRAERAADPWRDVSDAPLDLLARMAKACRLPPPELLANPRWQGFDERLIAQSAGTTFPYVFALPASGVSAPLTKPLTVGKIQTAWVLRLRGRTTTGEAAVSVRSSDNALLSDEVTVTAAEGDRVLFFYLDPTMINSRLVVRSNDTGARGGDFTLTNMDVLPRALLDEDDKIDLQAAMAEQSRKKPGVQAAVAAGASAAEAPAPPIAAGDVGANPEPAVSLDPHAAVAGVPLPPLGITAAVTDPHASINQCRADCGAKWSASQTCNVESGPFEKADPTICKRRADKAYNACLAACGPDPTGTPPPVLAKPKQKSNSKKSK